MTVQPPTTGPAVERTITLIDDIFGSLEPRDFSVRLWDGTTWGPGPGLMARVTVVLHHPGALRRLLLKANEVNAAECYIHGDVDLEGDVEALLPIGQQLVQQGRTLWDKVRLGRRLLSLPAGGSHDGNGLGRPSLKGGEHTVERDRQAVTYHYDVSNDFYRLWLDRNMVYSCASFADADEDLDSAQVRKLELLCRKLRLQPGERLLDIGCGWGGLLRHAARQYGVDALGITLSQPQADEANARIRAEGLAGRCRAEVVDYRQLRVDEPFDKILSVGMVEHVGADHLREYFATAFRLLRPGGAFLNHGIGDLPGRPPKKEGGFVRTYVFPDSDLPSLPRIFEAAEGVGFEGRDLESLREHYAMTLRHWVRRLEANHAAAAAEVGEATYRVWRLYMAGCAHWFARGWISVYQSLFVKRDPATGASGVPLTRSDWYERAVETASA